jgi:hypothetical protein
MVTRPDLSPVRFVLLRSLFARIVSRVDVHDGKRARTSDLNNGIFSSPCVVVHTRHDCTKPTGFERHALVHIKLIAHTDIEVARKHSHMLFGRMVVCGNFIVRGKL